MSMSSWTAYSTWTPQKARLFDGHYLRNHSTLDIDVLGYIGIVQHKEHSPESRTFHLGHLVYNYVYVGRDSLVGLANHYGLNGRGFKCHWWWNYPCCPDQPRVPPRHGYNDLSGSHSARRVILTTRLLEPGCERLETVPHPPFCACTGMLWDDL